MLGSAGLCCVGLRVAGLIAEMAGHIAQETGFCVQLRECHQETLLCWLNKQGMVPANSCHPSLLHAGNCIILALSRVMALPADTLERHLNGSKEVPGSPAKPLEHRAYGETLSYYGFHWQAHLGFSPERPGGIYCIANQMVGPIA